jgi:hypothetical protein
MNSIPYSFCLFSRRMLDAANFSITVFLPVAPPLFGGFEKSTSPGVGFTYLIDYQQQLLSFC